MNTTATNLIAWNGETYKGAGETYDWLRDLEACQDLDPDELLRLAIFAYNGGWALVEEDLPLLIGHENEAFQGEYASKAEFAEEFFESEYADLDQEGIIRHLVIDWEATYNYSLKFDFFEYDVIDIDGQYRKFFWSANV